MEVNKPLDFGVEEIMAEEKKSNTFPSELPVNPAELENPAAGKADKGEKPNQVLSGLLPGLILILLGGLVLLSHAGYLEGDWWQYFLVGMALVFMLEAYFQYRGSISLWAKIGRLISGLLMVLAGLLVLFDPNQWWPWVMIGLGIVICGQELRRRRKRNKSEIRISKSETN
jgi:hypothetical protein